MGSSQTLSLPERRILAAWAADCAERVLAVFKAEAPDDAHPRESIARTRAFARGELDVAGQIRRRFAGGDAARLAGTHLPASARAALRRLPPVGEDRAGPLGPGMLASGALGAIVRDLQAKLTEPGRTGPSTNEG